MNSKTYYRVINKKKYSIRWIDEGTFYDRHRGFITSPIVLTVAKRELITYSTWTGGVYQPFWTQSYEDLAKADEMMKKFLNREIDDLLMENLL